MTHQNQIISVSPIVFQVPNRLVDLEVKITAPVSGENLPVILLSHGHGASNFLSSYRGYAPIVDYYASHGFVVIQPTHQDSKTLKLDPTGPEGPLFWKSRAEDMIYVYDHMEDILSAIPNLAQRTEKTRVAAVGHSLGGNTVSMLAGMHVADPVLGKIVHIEEPRIKAFVVMGAPGIGADAAEWVSEHYPILKSTDYTKMTRDVLVVAGDRDKSAIFSARDNWRMDAYHFSPAPKTLLTVFNSGHILGGVSGYDVLETDQTKDENPETVAFVNEMTAAYIRTKLFPENKAWENAVEALAKNQQPKGKIDFKSV